MPPAMGQRALGRHLLRTAAASDGGYVVVPRAILEDVEGHAYPAELLELPWCAMHAETGGWNRSMVTQVDLLCTLAPFHDGDHGWHECALMPPEGVGPAGALEAA